MPDGRHRPAGPPPGREGTPAELLAEANSDLARVMDHLNQAAAGLTAARIKLTHLA